MNKFKDFLLKMITANTGISSKRVCGVIGWFISICVMLYCTLKTIEAPNITEFVIWASIVLLGVDSVTGIWKK